MLKLSIPAALMLLAPSLSAFADEVLTIHPKLPLAVVFESGGIGGEHAVVKARVTRESAREWCANWKPGSDPDTCVREAMQGEAGRIYEASADCLAGTLTSVNGDGYAYDGLWKNTESGFWDGFARFRAEPAGEVVGTSNAEGGLVIASQWRLLCPYGAPLGSHPLKMVLGPDDYSGVGELVGHDGSGVQVDPANGTMSYSVLDPKAEGVVVEGALLFRGTIIPNGLIEGMAFDYRKGCDPVPYKVSGAYPNQGNQIVLTGEAPVRDGCEVTGHSAEVPGARLVFTLSPG